MTWTEKFFSFRGRITRLDYWLCNLAVVAVICAAAALFVAFMDSGRSISDEWAIGLVVLVALIGFYPLSAIAVKRCHDRDKSGWWFVGWTVGGLIPLLGLFIRLWALVELGFLDGTQGENQYGPSPKGIATDKIPDVFA